LRHGELIALSILSVPVVSAVGSSASAKARRTVLADEMDRASNMRGGASASIVTSEGAGFYHRAMPERREKQSA
jgi:hypothetical protein